MIKTIITHALVAVFTFGSASNPVQLPQNEELTIVMPDEKRPIAQLKTSKKHFQKTGSEFMNFKLLGRCDTNISKRLKDALNTYTGPNIKITSLRRHFNRKSQHFHGNAVDMEFSHELIEYLVSNEGQEWLDFNNLMFYIEDVPGSRLLVRYQSDEKYAKYVFENPNATGEHIHIGIKR